MSHLLHGDDKGVVAENARALKHGGRSERDAVMASLKKADGLVHMKRDKPKKSSPSATLSRPPGGDDYAYGLKLDLDHESLTKLGISKLPAVGSPMHVTAKGRVHSISENSSEGEGDGKMRRNLNFQITHLKLAPHSKV